MATKFIPTKARDLRRGDKLRTYDERVVENPLPCNVPGHEGGVFFEIAGYDRGTGEYNGIHSDVCCSPDDVFVVRRSLSGLDSLAGLLG